jgi:hypothetical protein
MLKGFQYPLTPKGKSTLIPPRRGTILPPSSTPRSSPIRQLWHLYFPLKWILIHRRKSMVMLSSMTEGIRYWQFNRRSGS